MKRIAFLIIFIATALLTACGPSLSATPTLEIADKGPSECAKRVLVVVWGDLNGDGVQDSNEPPLADVLLMISTNEDPAGDGIRLWTNKDGKAHFPTRELENCLTIGYKILFLRQVAGYEFPTQPVVDLDDHVPNEDIVRFGLLPERKN